MKFSTVSVVGLGYIGLPTSAISAARGIRVIGVDVNASTVQTINQGNIHIIEPDLDMVVRAAVNQGYLRAVMQPEPADAFLIAVPTPLTDALTPDLGFVEAACDTIAPVLRPGNLVILESTSPVGTTEVMCERMARIRPDLRFPTAGQDGGADINIAYCPERVLPGKVLRELVENDRIIGGVTPACARRASELYQLFVTGRCIMTDSRMAEMCKLAENSFRDVNIAYANELSTMCDKFSLDVWELIRLANRHPRVNILQPGPGVGGHCIAVDPWFLVHGAPEEARLIRTAREVNDAKPSHVVRRAGEAVAEKPGSAIACMGLTFKPDIDDTRESPALEIVEQLALAGMAPLLVVEPHIKQLPESLRRHAQVRLASAKEALQEAGIVLMLVNHRDFYRIDRASLAGKIIIDTRGVWA